MQRLEIQPYHRIDARMAAPPSKAHTLRSLCLGALASGTTEIIHPLLADDQMVAILALKRLGIPIEWTTERIVIRGRGGRFQLPDRPLDVGMSGVMMHLLISMAALAPKGTIRINGAERMLHGRPVQKLLDSLKMLGVHTESVSRNGCLPVDIYSGGISGGHALVDSSINSQYLSSLLMSAPYASSDVTLETSGPVVSQPYIDITIDCMAKFGVEAINDDYRLFHVRSGQRYRGTQYQVEGDFSNASYFLGAAAVTKGRIRIDNLGQDSKQGDKIFLDILQRMGCKIQWATHSVALQGGDLTAVEMDLTNYPDLVPGLAVIASFARGTTVITGVSGLRYKECDRLSAVATELRKLGVQVVEGKNTLRITGTEMHRKGEIETYNDHRMAMSFSIAGLRVPGIVILHPEVVSKSFPGFFDCWKKLYS
jgi:3-phosphoshikimate 1-carboxyvinyltransferase